MQTVKDLPHCHTTVVFLIKPLPHLFSGVEEDAAGVLPQVEHPPISTQGDQVLGVEYRLLTEASDPKNTHLTLQSAQGTEQGGTQFIMQRGLLVVDVMVRLPRPGHL